jgi:predicted nucleotidyltransferase
MELSKKNEIRSKIKDRLLMKGIRKANLFGSFNSSDFNEKSDIDIVIEAYRSMSLMDLAILKRELEEITGFPIDITTFKSIDPRYRELFLRSSEELI